MSAKELLDAARETLIWQDEWDSQPSDGSAVQNFIDVASPRAIIEAFADYEAAVDALRMEAAARAIRLLNDAEAAPDAGLREAAEHLIAHGCNVYHADGPCRWQAAHPAPAPDPSENPYSDGPERQAWIEGWNARYAYAGRATPAGPAVDAPDLDVALRDWADDFDEGWGDRFAAEDFHEGGFGLMDHGLDHDRKEFRLLRLIRSLPSEPPRDPEHRRGRIIWPDPTDPLERDSETER